MGVALTEPGLIPFSDTCKEVETARELGAVIATHTACIWGMPSGLDQFAACGLLGPDIVHVHCNACTERDWTLLERSDAKISVTPETELQMGMGHPPIERALQAGLVLSLSCDVVSSNSGDMFTQMRLGLQDARARANDRDHAHRTDPTELAFTTRDALGWATVGGARALGMEDGIGSLAPGRQADVIVVGPGEDRPNMIAPVDAAAAVVQQANASNVREVLVAGRRVKRDGRLVGVDFAALKRDVEASRDGILERTLADGPILPDPKPSFDDIAGLLLPNLNVPAPA
jgi:5-methylthioadenosine/S-adenosylhomocysteine deaminase